MKQLEKEINVTSRKNMMKRYKMYGATVSKLTAVSYTHLTLPTNSLV